MIITCVDFNMYLPDETNIDDNVLHMDLPCETFRNLIEVDHFSKITVLVDCIYGNLSQVIN